MRHRCLQFQIEKSGYERCHMCAPMRRPRSDGGFARHPRCGKSTGVTSRRTGNFRNSERDALSSLSLIAISCAGTAQSCRFQPPTNPDARRSGPTSSPMSLDGGSAHGSSATMSARSRTPGSRNLANQYRELMSGNFSRFWRRHSPGCHVWKRRFLDFWRGPGDTFTTRGPFVGVRRPRSAMIVGNDWRRGP